MIEAVIFDLDGVIVSTDHYHYLAWKRMADEEGIPFDHHVNHRLRGVSRMESLEIILEQSSRSYSESEKVQLAQRKNNYYVESLKTLNAADILPHVNEVLHHLRQRQIRLAIGSSSRNTPLILRQIGLSDFFDAIADGNEITRSKPDPEVFLLAAHKLQVNASRCLVVEDAEAGILAAKRAGMLALAVGDARKTASADYRVDDLRLLMEIV